MTIVNRLNKGEVSPNFVVVHRDGQRYRPRLFAEALHDLDGLLFRSGKHEEGIILLSPTEIEAGRGMQMLAYAETIAKARELSNHAVSILSGAWRILPHRLAG